MKKKRFIVVNPDEELVFNADTQTVFFKNKNAAMKAVTKELNEPVAVDENLYVFSLGEENEWTKKDYRLFMEILK